MVRENVIVHYGSTTVLSVSSLTGILETHKAQ
jgi:hypothetical protein